MSNGWHKPTIPPYPACQGANCEQFCCPAPQESEPGNMGDSSGEIRPENNPSCKSFFFVVFLSGNNETSHHFTFSRLFTACQPL